MELKPCSKNIAQKISKTSSSSFANDEITSSTSFFFSSFFSGNCRRLPRFHRFFSVGKRVGSVSRWIEQKMPNSINNLLKIAPNLTWSKSQGVITSFCGFRHTMLKIFAQVLWKWPSFDHKTLIRPKISPFQPKFSSKPYKFLCWTKTFATYIKNFALRKKIAQTCALIRVFW